MTELDPVRDSILVVGGGIAGMTAAIALRRLGFAITLLDRDPQWRVYGAGISVTGLTLRALEDLDLLGPVRERGFVSAGMRIRSPRGDLLFDVPVPPQPAAIDSGGGILRPVLHDILSGAVRSEGIEVRLGVSPVALEHGPDAVTVRLSDGTVARHALVVGADGIASWMRSQVFPDAPKPRFTGQGCWRIVAPRPPEVDRIEMFVGGPVKLGLNPVSQAELYLFALEHVPLNPRFEAADRLPHLRQLLAPFGGTIAAIRDGLQESTDINYRPLEWVLVPSPWYRGRVVLVGDAAHATTPHLASGAGVAIEDGIVLAAEVARGGAIEDVLQRFMARRFERARFVVEESVKIGELEMSGQGAGQADRLIGQSLQSLRVAY